MCNRHAFLKKMNSKHGQMSNWSKYLKKNKQNICYLVFKDVNLSMDANWVLLITAFRIVWRSVETRFSMIQYEFKFNRWNNFRNNDTSTTNKQ